MVWSTSMQFYLQIDVQQLKTGQCQYYSRGGALLQYIGKNNVWAQQQSFKHSWKTSERLFLPTKKAEDHQKLQSIYLLPIMQPCGWRTCRPLAVVRDQTRGAQGSPYMKVPHGIPQILGLFMEPKS